MPGLARHAFFLWEGRAISQEAVDVVSRWGFVFTKSECFRNLSVSEKIVVLAARSPSAPKCSFNLTKGFTLVLPPPCKDFCALAASEHAVHALPETSYLNILPFVSCFPSRHRIRAT